MGWLRRDKKMQGGDSIESTQITKTVSPQSPAFNWRLMYPSQRKTPTILTIEKMGGVPSEMIRENNIYIYQPNINSLKTLPTLKK